MLVVTGSTHVQPHPLEQQSWDPEHELLSAQAMTHAPSEPEDGTGQLDWAEGVCVCVCIAIDNHTQTATIMLTTVLIFMDGNFFLV